MLGLISEIVSLAGPEIPGAARQVERTRPHSKGGTDKKPLPPAREGCGGERNSVINFTPLAGPVLTMVQRSRIQRFTWLRVDTSKAMVRASSSGGPNFISPSAWTSSRMAPARTRGRTSRENAVSTRARPPVRGRPGRESRDRGIATAVVLDFSDRWLFLFYSRSERSFLRARAFNICSCSGHSDAACAQASASCGNTGRNMRAVVRMDVEVLVSPNHTRPNRNNPLQGAYRCLT